MKDHSQTTRDSGYVKIPISTLLISMLIIGVFVGSVYIYQHNSSPNKNLFLGFEQNDIQQIKEAIRNGGDINAKNFEGKSLLTLAVENNKKDLVKYILGVYGAEVDIRDARGKTPLFYADRIDIAKLLLESEASPHVQDRKGNTPLIQQPEPLINELILREGGHINDQNNKGETALMIAAKECDLERLKILLKPEFEGNLKLKDNRNKTALMYASNCPETESEQYIKSVLYDKEEKERVVKERVLDSLYLDKYASQIHIKLEDKGMLGLSSVSSSKIRSLFSMKRKLRDREYFSLDIPEHTEHMILLVGSQEELDEIVKLADKIINIGKNIAKGKKLEIIEELISPTRLNETGIDEVNDQHYGSISGMLDVFLAERSEANRWESGNLILDRTNVYTSFTNRTLLKEKISEPWLGSDSIALCIQNTSLSQKANISVKVLYVVNPRVNHPIPYPKPIAENMGRDDLKYLSPLNFDRNKPNPLDQMEDLSPYNLYDLGGSIVPFEGIYGIQIYAGKSLKEIVNKARYYFDGDILVARNLYLIKKNDITQYPYKLMISPSNIECVVVCSAIKFQRDYFDHPTEAQHLGDANPVKIYENKGWINIESPNSRARKKCNC